MPDDNEKTTGEEQQAIDAAADICEALEKSAAMPEAGGVAWCEMFTSKGVRVNVTARGYTLPDAIDELVRGAEHAMKKYGWGFAHVGTAPQPHPVSEQTKPPAPQSPIAQPAPASAPQAPVEQREAIINEGDPGEPIHIKQLEVVVRPDGKVELRLFADGHKYADLVVVRTPDNALALLQQTGKWEEAHVKSAGVYPVNWIAEWQYGKVNQRGTGRYKNVTTLRVA